MNQAIIHQLSGFYGWTEPEITVLHSGLINHTCKVTVAGKSMILQRVNTAIFNEPELIDENLRKLSTYFAAQHSLYLFTSPVAGVSGETLCKLGDAYYRCFEFVSGSYTILTVQSRKQAFEAAQQFGRFTALLNRFDAGKLHLTLPDFHNLRLRYHQFQEALIKGDSDRITETKSLSDFLQSQQQIAERYDAFLANPDARIRVTHHDTKISNVLFDSEERGICVIDLDTVMPGYFLSDVGDMMRTYTCPVSEEEADLDKIIVRPKYIESIHAGYGSSMGEELTTFEQDHFLFAGEVLIYMQALRFLTDYLNQDKYYGSKYPGHNRVRAANQARLLIAYQEAIR